MSLPTKEAVLEIGSMKPIANLCGPCRICSSNRARCAPLGSFEISQLYASTVFEDLEVLFRQVEKQITLLVGHENFDVDDIDVQAVEKCRVARTGRLAD